MYRIGVDLGGTNIAVGLVDESYTLVEKYSVLTLATRSANEVILDICKAIDTLLEHAGVPRRKCLSIGIGAPGSCDSEKGIVFCSYSLTWRNVPLAEQLQEYFKLPVHVDNDANCAALAEVRAGAARDCQNAVLITLGTGIGTGIILDGKIYSGHLGSGTEMGHMSINMNGELCFCGRRGCWDAYASATALIVQAKRAGFCRPESALNRLEDFTAKAIFDLAEAGDIAANAVIEQYCEYLAVGAANVANVFGPEIILFGGGISKQGERILDPVRQYLMKHCFDTRPEVIPRLAIASMGNTAGIVGAAAL